MAAVGCGKKHGNNRFLREIPVCQFRFFQKNTAIELHVQSLFRSRLIFFNVAPLSRCLAIPMPVNSVKSCGFCGSKKHNLRTCPLPGAVELRRLRALTQPKKKASGSRVVRGNSEAARRVRQTFLKRPASLRRPAATVRQQYSGRLG